jgi:hypothetical protein
MSQCAIYAIVSILSSLPRWLCQRRWFGERILSGVVAAAACDGAADVRGLGLRVDVGRSESHCDDVSGGGASAMRGRRR